MLYRYGYVYTRSASFVKVGDAVSATSHHSASVTHSVTSIAQHSVKSIVQHYWAIIAGSASVHVLRRLLDSLLTCCTKWIRGLRRINGDRSRNTNAIHNPKLSTVNL